MWKEKVAKKDETSHCNKIEISILLNLAVALNDFDLNKIFYRQMSTIDYWDDSGNKR